MFDHGMLPENALESFLAQRQIVLSESITGDTHDLLLSHITYLNTLNKNPIQLLIHSGGGNCCATDHICDAIQASESPIHGIVMGDAASGAFTILQACHMRYAYPSAHLMFHSSDLSGVRVDSPSLRDDIAKILWDHRKSIHWVSKRSGQPIARVAEWSRTEHQFTPQEALKYGLIDFIVRGPLVKYKDV